MEFYITLLFIVILILILSLRKQTLQRLDQLEEEIWKLREQLARFSPAVKPTQPETVLPTVPEVKGSRQENERTQEKETRPLESLTAIIAVRPERTPAPTPPGPPTPPKLPLPPRSVEPGFFERHPDLEKFIGENLVSKFGIAILVLAVGFFVKYAIDNNWIGPVGRVGIGLLCGGVLIVIAHGLRNNYKAFSSILVGGGLAVFYFTIALAYHQFHLFGQTASFIIMLVITAFAVILSLLYDRQELAVIALVGGFATPLMVSNGSGDYKSLFCYLLILNSGLLAIAYNKAWRLLNLLAFIFTILLFSSWLFELPYNSVLAVYRGGFLFATVFYLLFFAINIANNIKENRKFIASDFGILLANTCLYFGAGQYLIAQMGMNKYAGLFSASMGVFNLAGSYFLFRRKKVDSNILYLLIGITLTFISLTGPIQLHGHYITLFWASESVLLYWLFLKSGIRIIRIASQLIWGAMLVSLFIDWVSVYGNSSHALPVIFNKALTTSVYSAVCCYTLFFLRRKEEGMQAPASGMPESQVAAGGIITGSLLLFIGGALEIHHQFNYHYPDTNLSLLYLLLYGFALACLITYAGIRWKWWPKYVYTGALAAACIVLYLICIPEVFYIQRVLLESDRYRMHFIAHWISDGLAILLFYRLIDGLRKGKIMGGNHPVYNWIFCTIAVIFLSAELHLLVNIFFYGKGNPLEEIQRVYIKTGLPILWGFCSFVFMWLGMQYKFKPLRIISLVLFLITLLKLFLFDISNIPVAGKIAAFFCLGVLLLIVSFMYLRLKKIIIDDEAKKEG